MREVKIIGNSTDSRRMYELAQKIVKDENIRIDLKWEDCTYSTASVRYNIKKFPAIVIEKKIISEGKNYSERDLKEIIKRNT